MSHTPVLLEETVEQLSILADGIYLDGTFGRGGHSREILSRLGTGGRLFALDRDPDAVEVGRALATSDDRFVIEQGSFGQLSNFLKGHDVFGELDGILLDLGVSSPQLEEPERGFSFLQDGPLDMRMDPTRGQTAADWIRSASEKEITDVLFRYGEETSARRIARAICAQRSLEPIETTGKLARLVENALPRQAGRKHPATRTFQAIRIHVNTELAELEAGLGQGFDALRPGGRMCVISFHSLEDRIVKRFFRNRSRIDPALARIPIVPKSAEPKMRLVARAMRPSTAELERNPRARSATLRVAERIA